MVFFFFFKQKTAYEITEGDWSSDVCSSDLPGGQTVTFPNRTFSRVDLLIDSTNFGRRTSYKSASGVGFSEVRVGGGPNGGPVPPVDEVTRLPTDLLSQAGTGSIDHRLVVLLTRLRSD